MTIIEPQQWPTIRDALPEADFLLDRLIPAGATTLLHGPPGCGKSAFAWGVANAISIGCPYVGLPTKRTNVLLISTDMNVYEYKLRWGTSFKPEFAFVCIPKMDLTARSILEQASLVSIASYAQVNQPLVVLDALGGFHAGKSAKDDEVATLVDAALERWLPDCAKLIIAHDRKTRYGADGRPMDPSADDFMGSQLWRANATSQLHMWKSGRHKSTLRHEKSQVAACMEDEIGLYIDMFGKAELWDEGRAGEVISKTRATFKKLGLAGLSASDQAKRLALEHSISERTAWRWISLTERL